MTDVEKWLGRIEKGVTIDVAQVGSNSQISEGSEITPSPNSSSSQSEPQGFALKNCLPYLDAMKPLPKRWQKTMEQRTFPGRCGELSVCTTIRRCLQLRFDISF
jgi:hypothetical protein